MSQRLTLHTHFIHLPSLGEILMQNQLSPVFYELVISVKAQMLYTQKAIFLYFLRLLQVLVLENFKHLGFEVINYRKKGNFQQFSHFFFREFSKNRQQKMNQKCVVKENLKKCFFHNS